MRSWCLVMFIASQVIARDHSLYKIMTDAQCQAACYSKPEASQCIARDCKDHKYQKKKDWLTIAGQPLPGDGPRDLRLLCRDNNRLVVDWTIPAYPHTPVFVLQLRSKKDSKWQPIVSPTPWSRQEVANLSSSTEYKIQVRAMVENGQLGSPTSSAWISTLNDLYEPQPVSNVRLQRELGLENGSLTAHVLWDPAEDRTCFYQSFLFWKEPYKYGDYSVKDTTVPRCPQSEAPEDKSFVCPVEEFHMALGKLLFDTEYTLLVVSKSEEMDGDQRESSKANLTFRSPTCESVNVLNSTVCPSPASDVIHLGDYDWKRRHNLKIAWPPRDSGKKPRDQTHKVIKVQGSRRWLMTSIDTNNDEQINHNSSDQPGSTLINGTHGDGDSNAGENQDLEFIMITLGTLLCIVVIAVLIFIILQRHFKKVACEAERNSFELQSASTILPPIKELVIIDMAKWAMDEWAISAGRVMIGDKLGEGAFGVVYKGLLMLKNDMNQMDVAVKMTRGDATPEEINEFKQEIEIMKAIGPHPHVVAIIGSSVVESRFLLITEYCSLGDLEHFLREEWSYRESLKKNLLACPGLGSQPENYLELAFATGGNGYETPRKSALPNLVTNQMYTLQNDGDPLVAPRISLTATDLISFATQIAKGMEFLSTNYVVHRDLAARNVLVCSDRTLKISDFGLSRDVYEQAVYCKQSDGKLPVKWMALESLMYQVYTSQSDVWSFGVLLWEIVTLGRAPYTDISASHVLKLLLTGYRMECPNNCCSRLYTIMTDCWKTIPTDRPTFRQLHYRLDALLRVLTQNQYLNTELLDNI